MKDQELAVQKRALEERARTSSIWKPGLRLSPATSCAYTPRTFWIEFEKARKVHNAELETKEKSFENGSRKA